MSGSNHMRKKSNFSDQNETKSIGSSNHEYEIDSMGILHHIPSNSSLTNALPSSYIDHRNYTTPNPGKSSRQKKPLSRRYSNAESPTQLTSPSFAERWMKRHSVSTIQATPPMMPLTNNNLTHLNQSINLADNKYGSVKIDMDKFVKDNNMFHADAANNTTSQFGNPFQDQDDHSMNSYQFGGSNPSDDSDGSTSLDDVCFPMEFDDEANDKSWPDLKVLEDFAADEMEMLKQQHLEDSKAFDNTEHPQSTESFESEREQVLFQNPIAKQLDESRTPLLSHAKVNEVEYMKGRLRPARIVPWGKQNSQELKTILAATPTTEYGDKEKFRFIYFREDLDQTIHSANLSGLLQTNQTFKDLFLASQYSKPAADLTLSHTNSHVPSIGVNNTAPSPVPVQVPGTSASASASVSNFNSTVPSTNVSNTVNHLSTPSPLPNATNGIANQSANILTSKNIQNIKNHSANIPTSAKNTPADTPTPSVFGNSNTQQTPFWLDVLNPTEEEMKVLSKTFGIHPLTTEDIFLGETREKVELFKDYYFICFRSFDIVYEKRKQKIIEQEKLQKIQENIAFENNNDNWYKKILDLVNRKSSNRKTARSSSAGLLPKKNDSIKTKKSKRRTGELEPLNMYIIVFRDAVITFHFSETPHPMNVRRRARLLRDYLTVSSDWIGYALIDDITDAFGPMIEAIEEEVNSIEDAILKMHSGDSSDSESESEDEVEEEMIRPKFKAAQSNESIFRRRTRSKSTIDNRSVRSHRSSASSKSSKSRSTNTNAIGWKRKGDMLRRIGECRKRVMSILRLLGSKADVIKGFAKRCNEQWESEIGMYLGDIQDHIVTMVQSLNHYEKLLARFHSNYLAQINIDMTKVNNDMNDVLGKITILGTIVLPINVVTGLWGMNVEVPGQYASGIGWFISIISFMIIFSTVAYFYTKRVTGIA